MKVVCPRALLRGPRFLGLAGRGAGAQESIVRDPGINALAGLGADEGLCLLPLGENTRGIDGKEGATFLSIKSEKVYTFREIHIPPLGDAVVSIEVGIDAHGKRLLVYVVCRESSPRAVVE